VDQGEHLNIAYVLPDVKGICIRLVIPSSLNMGWTESPPFFCAATETARDMVEELSKEPRGSLPSYPLDLLMIPPSVWPEESIIFTCISFVNMLEVCVDDFCTMVQTTDVDKLRHISRALLHGIHTIFPRLRYQDTTEEILCRTKSYQKGGAHGMYARRFWYGSLTGREDALRCRKKVGSHHNADQNGSTAGLHPIQEI